MFIAWIGDHKFIRAINHLGELDKVEYGSVKKKIHIQYTYTHNVYLKVQLKIG